ncbi:MAG TPA: fatty acid desaturase [Myxococcaceae bacterium]|nr:fatty acid desaturase [Myxococcaceae bacterium]
MAQETSAWRAEDARSWIQLLGTGAGYLVLVAAAYLSWEHSLWAGLPLGASAGLVLVRVFILQHDCAHRALFTRPRWNDRVGGLLGVLTHAPHAYWRAMHLIHHATSGDLDRRGHGDIQTLTAREYLGLSPAGRLRYRLFRHPLVLLGIGPIFQFLLRFRLPSQIEAGRRVERRSIALTNLGILGIHLGFLLFGDWARWMLLQLLVVQVSAGVGIWLFYVQHQVEHPYWMRRRQWSYRDAALKGSSHLVLPRPVEWLFGAINLHHVHHLDPQVPNYSLRPCMEGTGLAAAGVRLTLLGSLRTFGLKVYDEEQGRMTGLPDPTLRPAPGAGLSLSPEAPR